MDRQSRREQPRVYVFRGALPAALAVLLALPLLLVSLSLLAALLIGGGLAALLLPFSLRRRLAKQRMEPEAIELSEDDYRRIDDEPRRLP